MMIACLSLTSIFDVQWGIHSSPASPITMSSIDYQVQAEMSGMLDPWKDRVWDPKEKAVGAARATVVFGTYGSREVGYNDPKITELGIIAWQLFGLAGDLRVNGYRYLYVDETWLSYNSNQQRVFLENSNQYELIKAWNDPSTGEIRHLYRLVGEDRFSTESARQNLQTFGLGENYLEAFLQHESSFGMTPQDRVFDPSHTLLFNNARQVAVLLGGMLEEGNSPYTRESTFDWTRVFSFNQTELALELTLEEKSLLDDWRRTKLPGYLKALGYNFLGFDTQWLSYLSDEEFAILSDPHYYEFLGTFQIPVENRMVDFYYLYRIVDDTPDGEAN